MQVNDYWLQFSINCWKCWKYFDNIPKIKVIETYPDACEELDGLFRNATGCLMYEDEETSDYHIKFYKAVQKVF